MTEGGGTRVAGLAVGLACCAIVLLLVRIATGGTFDRLDVDPDSPGWVVAMAAGAFMTAVAVVLAVSLAIWPRLRLLWVALLFGAVIVPFALVLLSVGHQSATVVAALGLLIVAIAGYTLFLVRPPASGR
ncbi:MAG: hypothetical protein ACHQZR_02185 [Candidatus Limnocylindrales bacterium]